MSLDAGPIRGGTRGGKDQFKWEDVKSDKDRENYLAHSLMVNFTCFSFSFLFSFF